MKREIEYNGKKVDATSLTFKVLDVEDWVSVVVADGTTLRVKTGVLEVYRINGEYNDRGDPEYRIITQITVVHQEVPTHLMKGE